MLRTHYSNEITGKLNKKKVTLAGWNRIVREHGSLKFLILADRFGSVQITAKKGETPDKVFKQLTSLNKEDVIAISGTVKNNKQAPGGVEIMPDKLTVLNKSHTPLPLDFKVKANLDTRLDYRFLDMRKPEVRAVFRIKDVIQRGFVRYLENQGFVLMNTPVIVAAATEGGTNLFPISYFDKEAFLGQSPQLYKQMLMASGLDKVAITIPVFRAEEHDTSQHLNETTQMDIEAAFVKDEQDVLNYMSEVVNYIYKEVAKECSEELKLLNRKIEIPKLPVKQLTYDEALKIVQKSGIKMEWGEDFTPEAQRTLNKKFNPLISIKWPTSLRAFYSMPEPGNEKICRAYDMIIDGIEVCSGAQRIHIYDDLVKQMKKRNMNPDNFEFYLNAFKYGMPPHAGWSFGLERLTMVITGIKNIRESVLFPRDRKRLTP